MVLKKFEKSLVKLRVARKSLPGEAINFQRSFSFVVKFEVSVDSKILQVGPDGASLVVLGGFFIEGEESIKSKQAVLIVIILRVQRVDPLLVSLGDCAKASAGELMALVLVHQPVSRVPLEDDLEAPCGFGVESVIEQHFGLVISADVPPRKSNGIVEVDGKFFDDPRVVVIRDFPLLGQLDLL